ncbi:hypothetical protein TorRG33x02_322460 [Trema orientale]|uniref:Uncharacterized protein n=1 Tax=Trema orientale TaxID=63057 RepID=A0A2P5BFV9_TREOI|nr:hypothetical protein TorRG33x02_322460 [Trema orientale]
MLKANIVNEGKNLNHEDFELVVVDLDLVVCVVRGEEMVTWKLEVRKLGPEDEVDDGKPSVDSAKELLPILPVVVTSLR